MATRREWSNRLLIGGGVAIGLGLLLRVSLAFPRIGTNSSGQKKVSCDPLWVRDTGPYYIGTDPATLSEIVEGCSSAIVKATGLAKYGDIEALENALSTNQIPYQRVT